MAIDEINNKTDGIHDYLLPNTTIRSVFRDSTTWFHEGVESALEMINIVTTDDQGSQDSLTGLMGCVGPYWPESISGESTKDSWLLFDV